MDIIDTLKANMKEIQSKDVNKHLTFYISFNGSLEYAYNRLTELEEKLQGRGLEPIRPLSVFKIEFPGKPSYHQYAFELRKK